MASLFNKLLTLFKATLHDVADRAIERSDLSIYDEYIRQAEREVEQYKRTIAPLYAQVQTSKRRRDNLANQAARLDAAIDQFLMRNKKTEAMVTQKQLSSALSLIKTYDESLVKQVSALEKLEDVKVKLEGRLAIAKQEREELAYLLQLAQAKEASSQAMKSLDSLTRSSDSEMARAAENIRRRLDHADATWEIQAGSLDNQLDDAMNSLEVESELAARMERLGLN
jgi:phage shock protein A